MIRWTINVITKKSYILYIYINKWYKCESEGDDWSADFGARGAEWVSKITICHREGEIYI